MIPLFVFLIWCDLVNGILFYIQGSRPNGDGVKYFSCEATVQSTNAYPELIENIEQYNKQLSELGRKYAEDFVLTPMTDQGMMPYTKKLSWHAHNKDLFVRLAKTRL